MGRTVNPLALLSVVRIRSSPPYAGLSGPEKTLHGVVAGPRPRISLCGSWSTLHGMVARSAKEAQIQFLNCAGYAGVAQW